MRYRVVVEKGVDKQIAKLNKPVRRQIQRALLKLAENPRPRGVAALKHHPGHLRIRVGDYRVIYTVRDAQVLVLVVHVGHRSRAYREL